MMANEQNLKNGVATQFKSGAEAARNGSKGGKASGVAKRKKNAARKWLAEIMAYKPQITPNLRHGIEQLGGNVDDREYTAEALIMVALTQKAMKGDVKAMRLYLEMFGEDPRTVLEKQRLEVEKEAVKALKDSDGFMDAMKGIAGEVLDDGFDTPDDITDGE